MGREPASLVGTAVLSSSDVRPGFLMGMRLVPKRLLMRFVGEGISAYRAESAGGSSAWLGALGRLIGASVSDWALLGAVTTAALESTERACASSGTDASSARLEAHGSWSEAASILPAAVDDPNMNLMGDFSSLEAALAGGDPARPLPLVEVFPGALFGRVKALVRLFKGLFTGLGSDTMGEGIWPAFEGGLSTLEGVPKGADSA